MPYTPAMTTQVLEVPITNEIEVEQRIVVLEEAAGVAQSAPLRRVK